MCFNLLYCPELHRHHRRRRKRGKLFPATLRYRHRCHRAAATAAVSATSTAAAAIAGVIINATAAVAAGIAVSCYPPARQLPVRSAGRRQTTNRAGASSKHTPSEAPVIDADRRGLHCACVSGAAPAEPGSREIADMSGERTVGADLVRRRKRIKVLTHLAQGDGKIVSRAVRYGDFR